MGHESSTPLTLPAPHLDAKVKELYREWLRGPGKLGDSVTGPSGPERS